ncbi:2-phosphoglycolate phosphatase [Conidiobolus coronatus NRRL 28638]|uniref:4-nitrophenylphosphatase n=1 Tax=Conidiobolus coronatus (strain ATCC 28846 / CBS 209.66 / NRRL 28638) TaxID=796925 RepID=A0A137PCV1_CONC2|nr:2-phosphoglycolate phosphatase [Conidiobolus coronatus NRRL 28638]|eukprot:KXN72771.1 2-phosphoglycolate phosphatase [Conidiobolus coronatus NRRL 28638]
MVKTTQKLNNTNVKEFLDKYDTFLFDCDGVIWSGSNAIPQVPETINWLKNTLNKQCLFLTNNATKSRDSYLKKFSDIGILISKDEFFSSSYLAGVYLKNVLQLPSDKKVFVIGMEGIKEELNGLNIDNYSLEDYHPVDEDDLSKLGPNLDVGALVIGMDRGINYAKYAHGYQLLTQKPLVHFIACNDDPTDTVNGKFFPGTGSIISPLINSTKRVPTVVGKPNISALESINALYQLDLCRTCMTDTDIQFGLSGNLGTLLVFSGLTNEEQFSSQSDIIPEYVAESVAQLYNLN